LEILNERGKLIIKPYGGKVQIAYIAFFIIFLIAAIKGDSIHIVIFSIVLLLTFIVKYLAVCILDDETHELTLEFRNIVSKKIIRHAISEIDNIVLHEFLDSDCERIYEVILKLNSGKKYQILRTVHYDQAKTVKDSICSFLEKEQLKQIESS